MPYCEKDKVKPIEEEQGENKTTTEKCDYSCLSSMWPGAETDLRFSQPLILPNKAKRVRKRGSEVWRTVENPKGSPERRWEGHIPLPKVTELRIPKKPPTGGSRRLGG